MARVKKPKPSLENLFFVTPEQKVLRLLLAEPTTSFTPRTISSKLKGVRGLGGGDGIKRVLDDLLSLGLVEFVDNQRAVRLADENSMLEVVKTFASVCDLESLRDQIRSMAKRMVLYGTRAKGKAATDCHYDVLVVTSRADQEAEIRRIAGGHPLARSLSLTVVCEDRWHKLPQDNPNLHRMLECGIYLWCQP